jgi:aminocarboxymuconate-semialdehyde decarboxylase
MLAATSDAGNFDRPDLDALWGAAARLHKPIVIHPGGFKPPEHLAKYNAASLVGNPFETTLAVATLLAAGVPDRFGDLRLVLVHGGGFFPYQYGRIAAGYTRAPGLAGAQRPAADYLRWFFYDTILFDDAPTRYLLDLVGPDQVLAGSDCPFGMNDHRPWADPASLSLDAPGTEKVLGGNAIRLFGLLC